MPCLEIRKWTFSGLVGAFLDLSITFLLLCGSTLAYFASKFLAIFGLNLPCSCNGFFAIPESSNFCLQRQVVDYPLRKISSIRSSLKTRFPFDPIGNHSQWQSNLENYRNVVKNNEFAGSEGESSCISSSEKRAENIADEDLAKMKEKGFVMGAMNFPDLKERKPDGKWKGLSRNRSANNLRRRKKGGGDHRKLSQVPSFKSIWSDGETPNPSPVDFSNDKNKPGNDSDNNKDGKEESVVDIGSKRKISQGFELYESVDENEITDKENATDLDGNAKNAIRILELALEEEHAARASLYVELEKERSAAATAADEAMAMILRLQKEKASIEMEARQCQRMVEEKCEYDAEEMNILKEILIRREREKYYLEKEVEAYRQTISRNEQSGSDNIYGYCYSSDEDSVLTIARKSGGDSSIGKKYREDDNSSSVHGDVTGQAIVSNVEESTQKNITVASESLQSTTSSGNSSNQKPVNKSNEYVIHDVHVIDSQSGMSKQMTGDKNKQLSIIPATSNSSSATKSGNSCSFIPSGLPPVGNSRSKSLRSDMRRKSMSAFDVERYRIDNEITSLRERLKMVQEGRGKLKFSKGTKDKEKIQLQVLEDMTSQFREFQQLTEPGKADRRASLPPLTSNVLSKKRRWRSGPLLIDGST